MQLIIFFNLESPDKAVSEQAFPLVNYIPRPYKWNDGADPTDRTAWEAANNLSPRYYDDYGYEWNWWGWGGFRFLPQVNKDYSKSQTTTTYTSVPTVTLSNGGGTGASAYARISNGRVVSVTTYNKGKDFTSNKTVSHNFTQQFSPSPPQFSLSAQSHTEREKMSPCSQFHLVG